MKKTLLLLFLFISLYSYSQVVPRSTNTSNTLSDERVTVKQILVIPRYTDTIAANLKKGEDSTGAMIQTYSGGSKFWVRKGSPKRWVQTVDAETIINFTDSSSTRYTDSAARAANGYSTNVLWYNVIRNDNLTDSIGVKAAIANVAANGGGIVFFPKGIYNMPPFSIPTGVILVGEGKNDLPYFTGGDITQDKKGTTILIQGVAGKNCVEFKGTTHNNGIEKMSIYNDNVAAIESVVKLIDGNAYAHLRDVEVGCTKVTSGDGIKIEGNTLYWTLDNTTVNITGVGQSYEASVRRGLFLHSLGNEARPNAGTVRGGDFRGAYKSFEISSDVNNAKVQGLLLDGTTFESTYKTGMQIEYVAKSANIQELTQIDRYVAKWVSIDNVYGSVFIANYLELGGWPSTYNDGVHGVLPLVPVIEIGQTVINLAVVGSGIIGHLYDKSYTSQTYNRATYTTQNNNGEIGAFTNGSSSILYLGSGGEKSVGVREEKLIIKRKNTTWENTTVQGEQFQVFGSAYFDDLIRVGSFPDKQNGISIIVRDESDGYLKIAKTLKTIKVIDTLSVINTTGGVIVLGDSLNGFSIKSTPIDAGLARSELQFKANTINGITMNSDGNLILKVVGNGTSSDSLIVKSPDGTVKKVANISTTTATLDFPSTPANSSSDLTVTISGITSQMAATVNSQSVNSANSSWSVFIESNNTATVRFNNYSIGNIDPPSGTFIIKVIP